jgi:two-component system cell cycle response regulator DivK
MHLRSKFARDDAHTCISFPLHLHYAVSSDFHDLGWPNAAAGTCELSSALAFESRGQSCAVITTRRWGRVPVIPQGKSKPDIMVRLLEYSEMTKVVLLVEDDEDNRDLVEFVVARSRLGIELQIAENGEDALKRVREKKPDLILMDMQMPVMDGYTAASIIKADPQLRSIPIVAFTALARSEDVERSRSIGCVEHYTKPMDPEELVKIINKYVSQ